MTYYKVHFQRLDNLVHTLNFIKLKKEYTSIVHILIFKMQSVISMTNYTFKIKLTKVSLSVVEIVTLLRNAHLRPHQDILRMGSVQPRGGPMKDSASSLF